MKLHYTDICDPLSKVYPNVVSQLQNVPLFGPTLYISSRPRECINDRIVFFMAYIFIVNYSVVFRLFYFGLGLGLLNLASIWSVWPRPQAFDLV